MGLKPRFIKVEDESVGRYDVEDDFIDSLSELDDILLKIKISDYIDNNLPEYPDNKFTTYVAAPNLAEADGLPIRVRIAGCAPRHTSHVVDGLQQPCDEGVCQLDFVVCP